jgi:biotin carboxylase
MSVPALQVAEAASGLCDILWLVDESVPENVFTGRLLRKIGTVVDIGGLSFGELVSSLRAHAPDGLVAYHDGNIVLFSLLAGELGLEYHKAEVARRLVDKVAQREALRSGGLPTPLCWEIPADRNPEAIAAVAKNVIFPVVLKPRTGSGSLYTTFVADANDLVRQVTALPPQAGGKVGMFVEQYLPSPIVSSSEPYGDYLSVESLLVAGEITHVTVTGRFPLAEPFRETGWFIPADLPEAQLAAVLDVATSALRALEVRTGACHTEIKLTPEGPRVIEVNGRLGGLVPEMLFRASGVSLLRLSMAIAIAEQVVVESLVPCARVGWAYDFQPPMTARRFVGIEGLDRVSELPGVTEVLANRSPGDAIDWREGTSNFIFRVSGASTDYSAILEIIRFLHEEVSIAYEWGPTSPGGALPG